MPERDVTTSAPTGHERIGRFAVKRSTIDASVNLHRPTEDGGMAEARFVQRTDDRFIVYISSMTGCDKACRFCHLTATGQTMARLFSVEEMLEQAEAVLSLGVRGGATTVHFNFMARGEPLSNPSVDTELFERLAAIAAVRGLAARIKISTIVPADFAFGDPIAYAGPDCPPVDLYYSMYSTDAAFRRRWVPKAADPERALAWLRSFAEATGNRVILHWALIDGVNDDPSQALACASLAALAGLEFDFNLVRYNPPNAKSSEASGTATDAYLSAMNAMIAEGRRLRRVSRVGYDVAASCGMFLGGRLRGNRSAEAA